MNKAHRLFPFSSIAQWQTRLWQSYGYRIDSRLETFLGAFMNFSQECVNGIPFYRGDRLLLQICRMNHIVTVACLANENFWSPNCWHPGNANPMLPYRLARYGLLNSSVWLPNEPFSRLKIGFIFFVIVCK